MNAVDAIEIQGYNLTIGVNTPTECHDWQQILVEHFGISPASISFKRCHNYAFLYRVVAQIGDNFNRYLLTEIYQSEREANSHEQELTTKILTVI